MQHSMNPYDLQRLSKWHNSPSVLIITEILDPFTRIPSSLIADLGSNTAQGRFDYFDVSDDFCRMRSKNSLLFQSRSNLGVPSRIC